MTSTKQFYSNLGESLSNMKNSPFMRIGSFPLKDAPQKNHDFNDGQGLNYDPNRLFDPQKYRKQQQLMKEQAMKNQQQFQFIKNRQKQEQQAIQKIHYDLLKKNVEEDYASQVRKMEQMREYENQNYYSIFGTQRGVCLECAKCAKFEGCFNIEGIENEDLDSIEFMTCMKCACPMNSHGVYRMKNPHQSFIFQELIKCSIKDSHIKVDYNVFAFRYTPKNQEKVKNISPLQLFTVMQTLNHPMLSYRVITRKQFQITLLQGLITKNTNQINEGYLQALLSLLQNIKNVDISDQSDTEWFQQLEMNELYQNINDNIKKLANQLLSNTTTNIKTANPYQKIIVGLSVGTDFPAITQLLKSESFSDQLKQYKLVYSSNKSRKQSLLMAQNFFPKKFNLSYKIYLIPLTKEQRTRDSARFKDILDYNNCITFIEDPKNIQRALFEKAFTQFSTNKINYILGDELLSQKITRLSMKYVGKIGDSSFDIPFENAPDYVQISNQNQINKCLRLLYPEIAYSQRCVIVLRPFLLNENYEEVVINLLRVNSFTILKRVKIKISEAEAAYLATIENIVEEKERDQYIKYMTSGVCEIVLCSKRSAIYDAYALMNGSFDGKTAEPKSRFRNKPSVQIKKGKTTYEYEINASKPNISRQIFKSIRESINIEDIFFPQASAASHYLTNTKTGQIIKTQSMSSATTSSSNGFSETNSKKNYLTVSSVPPKFKTSLLNSIPSDNFNYWCMSSKSETITQELCSLFLPQCTLFQPITVLLKPHLSHLISPVINLLKEHKYHIIEHKKVQLPRILAAQLIINLQKVKLANKAQLKSVIDLYSSRQTWIICLSKVSGRTEIMRMLSDFSFLGSNISLTDKLETNKSISRNLMGLGVQLGDQTENISDQQLKSMLIPVWNSEELCLSQISSYLGNLQDAVRILEIYSHEIHASTNNLVSSSKSIRHYNEESRVPKTQLFKILNYFIGSFFGVPVTDLNLQTKLGILSYYTLEEMYLAKQQSWYYSIISTKYSNYGPLLFQYREIRQTILCIQSDRGVNFLQMIEKMYLEERRKIDEKDQKELQNQNNYSLRTKKKMGERKSLVLFLWAKKLYEMLVDLGKVETELKDYGQILLKNGEHRGHVSMEGAIREQQNFIEEMLQSFKQLPEIHQNIKKLLMSRCFKQRFVKNNTRLLPTFNNFTDSSSPSYHSSFQFSLRIVQKSHASKLILMDQHQFIDPENEHQTLNIKDLYTLTLYNIVPEIRTKYYMFAEIYILLLHKQFESNADNFREQMYTNFLELFKEMLSQIVDLEFLEYEIYLRILVEYSKICSNYIRGDEDIGQYEQAREGRPLYDKKNWILSLLRHYPNFRKYKKSDNDDVAGKKRKFLQRKQYFLRKDEQSEEAIQRIENRYKNVDINKFSDPAKQSVLYNPLDPFHNRLANTKNTINLLRDEPEKLLGPNKLGRTGINVEYEKNISEKEELLKERIKKQVEKFNIRDDSEQILHETGLEKELWYRRTKGITKQQPQSKTNIAIQKQIGKFMMFKKEEQRKVLEKQI